jgi:hypothetical protein
MFVLNGKETVEEKRGETGSGGLVWIILLLLVVLVDIKCFGEVKTFKKRCFRFLEPTSAIATPATLATPARRPVDDANGLFLLIRPKESTN